MNTLGPQVPVKGGKGATQPLTVLVRRGGQYIFAVQHSIQSQHIAQVRKLQMAQIAHFAFQDSSYTKKLCCQTKTYSSIRGCAASAQPTGGLE